MGSIAALDGAKLAKRVYDDLVVGGDVLAFYTDPTIGLQMALLQVGGRMVVAFRGTTSKQDILTDLDMFAYLQQAGVAHQFNQAGVILSQWIADPRYQLSTSNTTIVGHSLGGSLAQYFGATTGFETLTYNPYGIGNEISGGSNITNYITMHDPVSFLPGSKMIGTTYMLQDESLYDQLGHGISNFTSESSWVAGYSRVNSPRDIDVIDGMGLDSAYELALMAIEGRKFATINDSLDDVIFGGDINNILIGGGGNDWLEGGEGADILEGGAGKDVLIGGYTKDKVDAFTDTLKGGADFDTYISGDSDHITDSDGKGRVYFEGKLLTGGTKDAGEGCGTQPDGSEVYKGDGGIYTLKGSHLTFTKGGKILTFNDYIKNDLHITLTDNKGDGGACPSPAPDAPCPKPVNPLFNFNFSLPSPTRSVGGSGGVYYGGSYSVGSVSSSYTPSTPHRTPTPPIPVINCVSEKTHSSTGVGSGGGATPPIVLDLNRNGITSVSLAASKALFDYDGDGIKENTAWTENTDALLVNDTNGDGIINNATELFGNYTKNSDGSIAKSGYQALGYYDTNSDGVVNATDTRFTELKLWIDANGDGITNTGELKTLTEMGVTSLALNNLTTPYIPTTENTNTIIQETTFTDAKGAGIMRDILFRYENTSTNTEGVYFDMDGNGIQEKMLTWTDPNQWMVVKDINGDGQITSGKEVVGNHIQFESKNTRSAA